MATPTVTHDVHRRRSIKRRLILFVVVLAILLLALYGWIAQALLRVSR